MLDEVNNVIYKEAINFDLNAMNTCSLTPHCANSKPKSDAKMTWKLVKVTTDMKKKMATREGKRRRQYFRRHARKTYKYLSLDPSKKTDLRVRLRREGVFDIICNLMQIKERSSKIRYFNQAIKSLFKASYEWRLQNCLLNEDYLNWQNNIISKATKSKFKFVLENDWKAEQVKSEGKVCPIVKNKALNSESEKEKPTLVVQEFPQVSDLQE